MRVRYSGSFRRQFKKLEVKMQDKFQERLDLFLQNPAHPALRVHPLKGSYAGYWSMNVTGDLRALYRDEGDEIVIFAFIGTHSQLYG